MSKNDHAFSKAMLRIFLTFIVAMILLLFVDFPPVILLVACVAAFVFVFVYLPRLVDKIFGEADNNQ